MLFDLLYELNVGYKTVLLSGDVHYSQFLKPPCHSATGGQLIEFSNSGMTHNCATKDYMCKGLLTHIYTNTWKVNYPNK